jgi:hypothetical protein
MKEIMRLQGLVNGQSLFQYARSIATFKQLLPTYAYIKDWGGSSLRPYDQILYPYNYPYNDYLIDLNDPVKIDNINAREINVSNITGGDKNEKDTLDSVIVKSTALYMPKWEHGKVITELDGDGDGTVPAFSSSLFSPFKIEVADHIGLPTDASNIAVKILTGKEPTVDITPVMIPQKVLMIAILSPADMLITDPNGKKLGTDGSTEKNEIDRAFYSGAESEPELATIPDPAAGEYKVRVQGNESGSYRLSASLITGEPGADGGLITGFISAGDIEVYDVSYISGDIEITKLMNFDIFKKDLDELNGAGEINKKLVYTILSERIKHLQVKYDQWQGKSKCKDIILKKYILLNLNLMQKEIEFYKNMRWITGTAYDVLDYDLESIIKSI